MTSTLTAMLIQARASPTIVAMMAQGDASNIASNTFSQREKQSLLAMKALIERFCDDTL